MSPPIAKVPSQLKRDQWLFAWGMAELLHFITTNNWKPDIVQVRLADFYRPDKKGHMVNSRHYEMCAGDVILDVNGEYVEDSFHPVYVKMGEFWEHLGPRFRWGGRFRPADGNHFSVASPDGLRA